MNKMKTHLRCHKANHDCGESISGEVSWVLEKVPACFKLQLRWKTKGVGDEDSGVVQEIKFQGEQAEGLYEFSFDGVFEPCSFSGNLISIIWEVVLITPDSQMRKILLPFRNRPLAIEIVIGPGGAEIVCLPNEGKR